MVTVDKVLSHGFFDDILHSDENNFADELSKRVRKEASKCTDLKRLTVIVAVALNLLHSNKVDTKTTICIFLMKLLAHRFPRVRSHTAEQLYVKLIEDASVIPNPVDLNAAQKLLSETAWDRDLGAPHHIRLKRNKVSEYLGIILSEKDLQENVKAKVSTKAKDDFASYASLVHSL